MPDSDALRPERPVAGATRFSRTGLWAVGPPRVDLDKACQTPDATLSPWGV